MRSFYPTTTKQSIFTLVLIDILAVYTFITLACTWFYKYIPSASLNQHLVNLIKTTTKISTEQRTNDVVSVIRYLFIIILARKIMLSLHTKGAALEGERFEIVFDSNVLFECDLKSYTAGKAVSICFKGLVISFVCTILYYFTPDQRSSFVDSFKELFIIDTSILAIITLIMLIVLCTPKGIKCQYYWFILAITLIVKYARQFNKNQKDLATLNSDNGYFEKYDNKNTFFNQTVKEMIVERQLQDKIFITKTTTQTHNQIDLTTLPLDKKYLIVYCCNENPIKEDHKINDILTWQMLYLDKKPVFGQFIIACIFLALSFLIFIYIENTLIPIYSEEVETRKWIKTALITVTLLLFYVLNTLWSNALNYLLINITNRQFKNQIGDTQSYMEWLITDYYVNSNQPMSFPSIFMLLSSDKPSIYSYLKVLENNQ